MYNKKYKLIFFIIFLNLAISFLEASEKNQRIALVMGNGAYQYIGTLDNPTNDANDVAIALESLGFNVIKSIDATKIEMDIKFDLYRQALNNADVGLFFYAGHGLQINNENYLVPIDAKFNQEFNVSRQLVGISPLLTSKKRRSKVNLVFLDACRNNPLVDILKKGLSSGRAVTLDGERKVGSIGKGLAILRGDVINTLIAFATAPGSVALDGKGKNSPFTIEFLKYIQEPGLEVRQFLTKVRLGVLNKTHYRQVPWDNSSLTEDFYFKGAEKAWKIPLAPP